MSEEQMTALQLEKRADEFYKNKQYADALEIYMQIADKSGRACNRIGFIFDEGLGVDRDLQKAFEYYKKSAEMGNDGGANNLRYQYFTGQGVDKNYSEAVKWYKKAAESGVANALHALGIIYKSGYGVEKNPEAAREYFEKAAAKGHSGAMKELIKMDAASETKNDGSEAEERERLYSPRENGIYRITPSQLMTHKSSDGSDRLECFHFIHRCQPVL